MELDSPRRDGGLCPLGQRHLQQLRLHLPQASGPVRDPPLPKRKGDCGNTVLQNIRQRLGMSFHLPAVMVQHKIDDDFCEVRQCQRGVQPVIRCAALPEIRQHASGQFRLGFQIQQPEPALHNSLQIRPPRRFIFYRDAESLDDCVAGLADQFPVVHCQCPGQSLAGPLFLCNLDAVLFTERHLVSKRIQQCGPCVVPGRRFQAGIKAHDHTGKHIRNKVELRASHNRLPVIVGHQIDIRDGGVDLVQVSRSVRLLAGRPGNAPHILVVGDCSGPLLHVHKLVGVVSELALRRIRLR